METPRTPQPSTSSLRSRLRELGNEDTRLGFAKICAELERQRAMGRDLSPDAIAAYNDMRKLINFAANLAGGDPARMVYNWREGLRKGVASEVQKTGGSLGNFPLSRCYLMAVFAPQRVWNSQVREEELLKTLGLQI